MVFYFYFYSNFKRTLCKQTVEILTRRCVLLKSSLRMDSALAFALCKQQRTRTFFNELKRPLTPELTNFNVYHRVSMKVKIYPNAEKTLSQFVIVFIQDLVSWVRCGTWFYQSPLILTELFQHNLRNVSYLTACFLLSGHDDVALFEWRRQWHWINTEIKNYVIIASLKSV